jgi:hypothetical protein
LSAPLAFRAVELSLPKSSLIELSPAEFSLAGLSPAGLSLAELSPDELSPGLLQIVYIVDCSPEVFGAEKIVSNGLVHA